MEISIKWSMCRACLAERCTTLRPLLESEAAKHLKELAGLVVKKDDGLPDQICAECVGKMEEVICFISMCQRSDEHLRSLVSKTMSSAASFKTSVSKGSPPIQRKRPRKQELTSQKCIPFPVDDITEEPLKSEEEFLPIKNNLSAEEEPETEDLLTIEKSLSAEEESNLVYVLDTETDKCSEEFIIMNSDGRFDDNDFEATSSQGSPIVIHNGTYSQEASEEDSSAQKSDTASENNVDLQKPCLPGQHKCEICSKTYPNLSQLKSHKRTHLNEKKYECEVCNKAFNAACNLTAHMRTHTGEKPFKCAYCPRRFGDHSSHRKHERIHTNERPYVCNICGKAFTLSTSLKAHYMTHSSEKPYKCQPCLKSFRLKHQLVAHEKTDAHRLGCAELSSQ